MLKNRDHQFYDGHVSKDQYCVEMFQRALVQGKQRARKWVEGYFHETLLGWIHRHPYKEMACRLYSEQGYVLQTFERLWQTTNAQVLQLSTSSAVLRYMQTSLNGVILDALRADAQSKKETAHLQVLRRENSDDKRNLWEVLQELLPDIRQQRLAYLLYHCALQPKEIVSSYPHEFSEVHEVYRLRFTILERLKHHWEEHGNV